MRFRNIFALVPAVLLLIGVTRAQRPFREYPGVEYEDFPLPPDYQEKTEWVFARLMYPPAPYGWRSRGDWTQGQSSWTTDYPRSDRHLSQAVRRLTRIHARSVEQPVNLDEGDDVFNWPWLYAVEVGHWNLTDAQAGKLREYLLRGGFFMCDDFHGTREWSVFIASMQRVFPDRPIVDIGNSEAIFHVLYDLDERYQVPGAQYLRSGRLYEYDGFEPRWRGIFDDKGRLMVAICHNMDLGDSWEWADDPRYPEKFSALGIRIAINYIMYAMTHQDVPEPTPKIDLRMRDVRDFMSRDRWWELPNLRRLLGSDAPASIALGYSFGPDRQHPEYAFLATGVADAKRLFVFLNSGALVTFDLLVAPAARLLIHGPDEPKIARTTILPNAGDLVLTRAGESIELSSRKTSGDTLFLNVMQSGTALPVEEISSMDIAGVRLSDRVAAFYTESNSARSAVSFSVHGSGTLKCLVAGLAPGSWEIWRNGWLEDPQGVVERQAGALYFEGPAGGYFFRKL